MVHRRSDAREKHDRLDLVLSEDPLQSLPVRRIKRIEGKILP